MSSFEHLHPALQHHIVNSLGWRELRPFQEAVIPQVLDGKHLVILAPTAGGKTEASFFPALSRMLSEDWQGLSILYICPIKALLNNLDHRLQRYCTLLGRRSALWHGDVKASARKQILKEPPDCLLTTPESLEVMLVSSKVDSRRLFQNLQMVIVDEIHAFAGDDRGWHLLSVLERVSRMAGRELQRIGLSATVGNPDVLVDWLAGSCHGERAVFRPNAAEGDRADVQLDFVGSLANAAVVISRLHHGEKRLVFVDSRSRAEQLAAELRRLEVTTFVTHSSLSQEQRHQAEEAFAARSDCVIVATSVLELGIDVGDLDRVVQIDSPSTVSSFLQRMGRTGRRSEARRNCLFLATKDHALIQAAALLDLWQQGYVEPIAPPTLPFHVLAQQLMGLVLQESGIGRQEWFSWVCGVAGFAGMEAEEVSQLLDQMLHEQILWTDQGILGMGPEGERLYGAKHFLALFSVFTSPPLFAVLHGRREIGYVDESMFFAKQDGPRILLLGGRPWQVVHLDWQRRLAYVEPTEILGRTRWQGPGQGLEYRLAQAIRQVLASEDQPEHRSRRASARINEIRHEHAWLRPESTVVLAGREAGAEWWTFGGTRANATLCRQLSEAIEGKITYDSFTLKFAKQIPMAELEAALAALRQEDVTKMRPAIAETAIEGIKFAECLPRELAERMLERRLQDVAATQAILTEPTRFVIQE